MRILVLILASDGPIYNEFQALWRKYMKTHPQIDCFFYKGNPNLPWPAHLDGDTLWLRVPDTIPYVYQKMVMAFQTFLPVLDKYDFVFRPNLSSCVNLHAYYELCKTFPKTRLCSAEVNAHMAGVPIERYPSGAGFTLSSDIVRHIANNPLRYGIMDDVAMGMHLESMGIQILPAPRANFVDRRFEKRDVDAAIPNHFHFRFRSPWRDYDVFLMEYLIDKLYSHVK